MKKLLILAALFTLYAPVSMAYYYNVVIDGEVVTLDLSLPEDLDLEFEDDDGPIWTRPADIRDGDFVPVDESYGPEFRSRLFRINDRRGIEATPVMNNRGEFRWRFRFKDY